MLLQTSVDIPSDPGLAISLCDPPIAANKYAVTETDSQFGEIKEELTELTVNLYYQNGRAKKRLLGISNIHLRLSSLEEELDWRVLFRRLPSHEGYIST